MGGRLRIDAGLQTNAAIGVPPMGYFRTPVSSSLGGSMDPPIGQPFPVGSQTTLDANLFAQGIWQTPRTFLSGGLAVQLTLEAPTLVAPRLAFRHAVDSTKWVRLSYAEGFQRPLPFRAAHTYRLDSALNARPLIADGERVGLAERVRSTEVGIGFRPKWLSAEVSAFYQEAHQLARDGALRQTSAGWYYGFQTTPGLGLRLWGVQCVLSRDFFHSPAYREELGKNQVGVHASYAFQYSRGQEWVDDERLLLSDVRNYPRRLTQVRLLFFGRKWELSLLYLRSATILSGAAAYPALYRRAITPTAQPNYATVDVGFRLFLSDYFSAYLDIRNLFNRRYAGIDATQTPNDLLYNPQPRQLLRVGISYVLD